MVSEKNGRREFVEEMQKNSNHNKEADALSSTELFEGVTSADLEAELERSMKAILAALGAQD